MNDPIDDVPRIVQDIRPLLDGHPPEIQSAVLADLLAIWLASHLIRGHPEQTDAIREKLLDLHIAMVRDLVAVNATEIHGPAP